MSLLSALRQFQQGALTRHQLLSAWDTTLRDELADAELVSQAIREVSEWDEFPNDITIALEMRLQEITRHSLDDDVTRSYAGNEPFVYACYATADDAAVRQEVADWQSQGLRCYFDAREQANSQWLDQVAARILQTTLFVFFMSPGSAASDRCRRELGLAMESKLPILVVEISPAELPPGLRLSLGSHPTLIRHGKSDDEFFRDLREMLAQLKLDRLWAPPETGPAPSPPSPGVSGDVAEGDLLAGRFLLKEQLGAGGMSIVYRATDTHAYGSPDVAVKIINPVFSQHPDSIVALQRETAKTQQLNHPNIVSVRDFRIQAPHAFMWMEYLEGQSLQDRMGRAGTGCVDAAQATLILTGIADGLSYAHQNNIVHADFKPGNVMLTADPVTSKLQVKIIDFGIARAVRHADAEDEEKTIFDPAVLKAFTPPYASPELIANESAQPADDVYALACITYQMFTGVHPFDRAAADQAKRDGLVVAPREPLTTRQLTAVRKGLAFERAQRTQSVDEFVRDFLEEPKSAGTDQPASTVRERPKRRWALWLGTASALALAIALVATQVDWGALEGLGSPPIGSTIVDCPQCPELVVVPAGEFLQGSATGGLSSERPTRLVRIARPLAVATGEVTVAQFRAYAETGGDDPTGCTVLRSTGWEDDPAAGWQSPGFGQSDDHPVTCVSWHDALAYTQWLTERTGHPYRLLSASEWEYVAADDKAAIMDGACAQANVADAAAAETYPSWQTASCNDGSTFTSAPAERAANAFGIYDLIGNAFEWVADCWNASYAGAPTDGSAWSSGDCAQREARGGSWYTSPDHARPRFRNHLPSDARTSTVGFRVVRDL